MSGAASLFPKQQQQQIEDFTPARASLAVRPPGVGVTTTRVPENNQLALRRHADELFGRGPSVLPTPCSGVRSASLLSVNHASGIRSIAPRRPTGSVDVQARLSGEIAEFIRSKGVTRCPNACVAATESSVSARDAEALRRRAEELEAQKAAKKAYRSKKAA